MSIQEQIDKLQASITAQQAQLDALKLKMENPKEWEPPTGKFMIDPCGYNGAIEFATGQHKTPHYVDFGFARKTREQAELDAVDIRKFSRMLAWRAENCRWSQSYNVDWLEVAKHFFTHTTFNAFKEKFNSGEV